MNGDECFRGSYFVLAILFLNSGLTGISAILLGTKRLLDVADGEDFIDHHECVLNMPILLFSTYFLNGVSLLINSVERLCVVALPIYYYTNSIRINYALIVIQYTITIIAITVTAVASLIEPSRRISNFCMIQEVYSHHFFKALILLSSLASLMSVVIMVVVVVILKNSCGGTVSTGKYLRRGSFHRVANHCDLLRAFAYTEFPQHGCALYISSKGFSACCNSMFQIRTL
ncbi:unnamed protein product [Acanthocheilonema viteae]|uniref:G-protein coupled receptors family 1 profile domain-containing protein n=1 Tax=Acanthocheilonema viteae TaxID=6277 RepID=A0A498S1Q0_ACAVI|nr:unnamed protein product [Acanthocheilonema viteae]